MATILNKNLVRETTVEGGKTQKIIMITLNSNQEIELKLKGTKSKPKIIKISDLWNTLNGKETTEIKVSDSELLNEIRSHALISAEDYKFKVKMDTIITDVKKQLKKPTKK
jgi:hypothetical protein